MKPIKAQRFKADYDRNMARSKARYRAKKAELNVYRKAWHERNKEKALEQMREYNRINSATLREKSRAYYQSHKEQAKQAQARWIAANPWCAAQQRQKRRARLQSVVENTLTRADIKDAIEVSCGLCAYCLRPYGRPTVDHVTALARGGANAAYNIVIACQSCNSSKNARGILVMVNRAA